MTLAEIENKTILKEGNHLYLVSNNNNNNNNNKIETPISVVYYRAGYTPDDYPSEKEWSARIRVEKSTAIKCPTVGYQLAGTKKIQQVLCELNVLETFLEPDDCEVLRTCFAGNK